MIKAEIIRIIFLVQFFSISFSLHRPIVVIIPGFLTGSNLFKDAAETMQTMNVDAVIAPIEWYHWIPLLGGRSVRPILERIDFAVNYALIESSTGEQMPLVCPLPHYSSIDFVHDLISNPGGIFNVGGVSDPTKFPNTIPAGDFSLPKLTSDIDSSVFLVGHSASGWISRIYLSGQEYAGCVFEGKNKVAGLVTLGTPHRSAPGFPALVNVEFASHLNVDVPCLAVAGTGVTGQAGGQFTVESYILCGDDETNTAQSDGDGVTPVSSALAFQGAEVMTLKEACLHLPSFPAWLAPKLHRLQSDTKMSWYGGASALKEWLPWILRIQKERLT